MLALKKLLLLKCRKNGAPEVIGGIAVLILRIKRQLDIHIQNA